LGVTRRVVVKVGTLRLQGIPVSERRWVISALQSELASMARTNSRALAAPGAGRVLGLALETKLLKAPHGGGSV
jgi:hypothetical protein